MAAAADHDRLETGPGQGVGTADVARFMIRATPGDAPGGVVFVAFIEYGQARPAAQAVPA